MNHFIENLKGAIHQYWKKQQEEYFRRDFLDHLLARRYYKKKHAWYEKTYWEGYTGNDIFRPNGIIGENKEHLFTKAHIVMENINADGHIIDFGCGNGLLLKVIQDRSPFKLTPHGVDFLSKSIEQAHQYFPENRRNFSDQNILDYQFDTVFRYILCSPGYLRKKDLYGFLHRCFSFLETGGKIIFFSTPDTLYQLQDRMDPLEKFLGKKITLQHRLGIYWIILEKSDAR